MSKTHNATIALRERAEFTHKGCLVLAERGLSRKEISSIMGVSGRTVRALLSRPCAALIAERKQSMKREAIERRNLEEFGKLPFCQEDDYLTDKQVQIKALREAVRHLKEQEGLSTVEVAKRLGLSRQVVSYHVKKIRE